MGGEYFAPAGKLVAWRSETLLEVGLLPFNPQSVQDLYLCDMRLDLDVRLATSDDAASVAAIDVTTRQVAFAHIVPGDILRDRYGYDNRLKTWRRRLGDRTSNSAVFIAEHSGEACGYVMVGNARDGDAGPRCGEIYDLYVLPRHWQGGVGSSLLQRAVEYLEAGGSDHVTLWCSAGNARAEAFYREFGFVRDGSEVTRPSGVKELRWRMVLPAL